MNEKRPIPEVVDEKRDLHYSSTTLGIGLFLFIHNL
jgi:hypothetical protein